MYVDDMIMTFDVLDLGLEESVFPLNKLEFIANIVDNLDWTRLVLSKMQMMREMLAPLELLIDTSWTLLR